MKKLIKKIIPRSLKNYIKREISSAGNSEISNVEYKISIDDVGKMKGKRVIVTGANGAIGSAICQRLYIEGAIVGVAGRNAEKIVSLIARLNNEHFENAGQLIPLYIDLENETSIDECVDNFVELTGGIDVLVNNAGGSAREDNKQICDQSKVVIEQVLRVNLLGSIFCSKKVGNIMRNQKQGVIINMSSVVGTNGKDSMSDYAAAKAGVIGFTKSLAIELGAYNIRVNCISPGMIRQRPFDYGEPEMFTDKNCLKRYGYTDEVAAVAIFLMSEDARYITGQNIVVDGGRSLGLMGDS